MTRRGRSTIGALAVAALLLPACSARRGAAPHLSGEVWGVQRLVRVGYAGPEGSGSFRLAMRLAGPERFQLLASDPLGRSMWVLDAQGDRLLWIDRTRGTYCRAIGELPGAPWQPLTWTDLPAIVGGRLPRGAEAEGGADERRWTVREEGGRLEEWTLWRGGEPLWWWRRTADGGVLSQRGTGRQLDWRELAVEPLAAELEPLAVPVDYVESCRVALS